MRIFAIGHGARLLDEFLALLEGSGIEAVADIRTTPASRRHPHFALEALRDALAQRGIVYEHFPELGGLRRERGPTEHTAIRVAAFRAYADHMATADFHLGYERLTALAVRITTAHMCAETLWQRCHRRLLSDRLVNDGWEVVHLLGAGKSEPHRLWDVVRVADGRLVYDAGRLPLVTLDQTGPVRL